MREECDNQKKQIVTTTGKLQTWVEMNTNYVSSSFFEIYKSWIFVIVTCTYSWWMFYNISVYLNGASTEPLYY